MEEILKEAGLDIIDYGLLGSLFVLMAMVTWFTVRYSQKVMARQLEICNKTNERLINGMKEDVESVVARQSDHHTNFSEMKVSIDMLGQNVASIKGTLEARSHGNS